MVAGRTHHPVWNEEACLGCFACRHACPARVDDDLRAEPDSLRGRVARSVAFPAGGVTAVAPCTAACPLGQDVPGYLSAIARGDVEEARAIILDTNPLPRVLSRMCSRPCVRACVRAQLDAPPDIRALKAVPFAHIASPPIVPERDGGDAEAVVIGAGPAGLAAAATLARAGVRPTLVEGSDRLGGLLASGVPDFVLPPELLRADVERIAAACGEVRTGTSVDAAWIGAELAGPARRAVILAAGAVPAPIEPALAAGARTRDAVGLLREARRERLRGPALVCGESPAALAAARSLVRRGAAPVVLATRRPAAVRAGDEDAWEEARAEGVHVVHSRTPVEARRSGGGVRVVLEVTAPRDAGGGRVVPGEPVRTETRRAELFVLDRRRVPDPSLLEGLAGVRRGPARNLMVNHTSLAAGPPGLFAAGEAVTGSRTVVEAVWSGIRAARSALSFLEVVP
jgi:NADPH-dependent glutamate synthase beta subunit-like oxidoreductase